jgi:hypothetical protein
MIRADNCFKPARFVLTRREISHLAGVKPFFAAGG